MLSITWGAQTGYMIAVTQRANALRSIVGENRATITDEISKRKVFEAQIDSRLRLLELAVFGPKPPSSPAAVESWQKNRDKEFRDRLSRLEQWRLKQEEK